MLHDASTPTPGGFFHTLIQWLAGNGYAPHSGCFLGDKSWVAAYVAGNWIIALAYTLISLLIAQRMKRASHIPRTLMGNALLGIFVTCAVGHFLAGVTTVLWPGYRLETFWHWLTVVPAWIFLAHHNKFSLIVEGPHMIAETREELSHKNEELNTLYEQVKQVDKLKSEFFANVSHELRTPLALILGPVSNVLAGDNLTDAQRRDLEVVARNARTVLKHVNDLLDVARMEAGKMRMHYSEADLASMARVLASHFESVIAERDLAFTIDAPDTLAAQVDGDKIQRVLLNLFSNAVKFTPAGGTIACRLRYENTDAIIEVEDNGPGIPLELRQSIFERFRQVDGSATRRHEGTGLGLAIVKDFVELHGGSIAALEARGGGALFHVALPLFAPPGVEVEAAGAEGEPAAASAARDLIGDLAAPESDDAPDANAEPDASFRAGPRALHDRMENVMIQTLDELRAREQAEAIAQETGQPLVLVVEDNREMSRFIAQTLAGAYRVAIAHDGQAGLERALDLRPDLILSDIMMPTMSGDQMVAQIRTHSPLDAVPIVLLTAKADDDLRVRLLREGAQDYLMKPFAPEELRARVANMVSMKRARQVLEEELALRQQSLESLALEITDRKRALQTALEQAHSANAAEARARAQAEELRYLAEARNAQLTAAIQEAHHRIKNNLQLVSALMEMRLTGNSDGLSAGAIRAYLRQVKAIAQTHNLLTRDSDYSEADAALALDGLVLLLASGEPDALPIRLHADTLLVPARVATSLILIVNELVINARKFGRANALPSPASAQTAETEPDISHSASSYSFLDTSSFDTPVHAFRQESDSENAIFIDLRHVGAEAILVVADPGPGFAPDFNVFRDAHLGVELVATLVESDLQGHLRFGSAPDAGGDPTGGHARGGRVEIRFPERPDAA